MILVHDSELKTAPVSWFEVHAQEIIRTVRAWIFSGLCALEPEPARERDADGVKVKGVGLKNYFRGIYIVKLSFLQKFLQNFETVFANFMGNPMCEKARVCWKARFKERAHSNRANILVGTGLLIDLFIPFR